MKEHLGVFGMLAVLTAVQPAAAQTPPPSFDALSEQAGAARDAKQLDKAIKLYQQALKLKPAWEEGWWSLGSITYDLDRYTDCGPAFRRLAKLKPDSAPAWTMAGLCEYKLRRVDAALECLGHAEQLQFQEPPELAHAARLHYALLLTKSGAFEKAVAILTELTRVDHKSPEIVAAAGIAGLRRAWLPFEVPESDRELVFKLGDAMASAMDFDAKEAIGKFEELVQQYPDEPNAHFRFGAYLATEDSDRGIAEIKKAVALLPTHIPALVGLATIYLKREEPDQALAYARRAVQANASDFSAHIELGRALLAKEDPAGAAAELEEAVKLSPASVEARYSLASAYSRLGRKEDAARELAEFKRLQERAK
jgi:tetratricopeptide (TPR) repeat protein